MLLRQLFKFQKFNFHRSLSSTTLSVEKKYKILNDYSINVNSQHKILIIDNKLKQQTLRYPIAWLRDNCQCSECFHGDSSSRTVNWEHFDVNSYPVDFDMDGESLKIVWNDNHVSSHNISWLMERRFEKDHQQKYLETHYRPRKTLWKRDDFSNILKSFEYDRVINTDAGLRSWLQALAEYGIVMIKNTPSNEDECRRVASRVDFIKKTHYGEEFIVKAKEGTSNVAYLSAPLQLHTDLPYYEYKPGVNLLHCLVQSESSGGANQISDGFYVANLMRKEFPEDYRILTTTLVNWNDIGNENGNDFHSIYRAPVICVGRDGQLERINNSVPQRDSFFTIPLEEVNAWYLAKSKFVQLLYQEAVTFKTKPGDILTFDNIRMVHGRVGVSDLNRHIVGAYLDWDLIYSRLRVLNSEKYPKY